jgi:hypothetical protein
LDPVQAYEARAMWRTTETLVTGMSERDQNGLRSGFPTICTRHAKNPLLDAWQKRWDIKCRLQLKRILFSFMTNTQRGTTRPIYSNWTESVDRYW